MPLVAAAGEPPGDRPGRLRRTEFIVIPWSAELQAAKDVLGLALVAVVGGTRPTVSPAMVSRYLLERFDMTTYDTEVSRHDLEDFVVRFRCWEDRDHVLAAPMMGAPLPLV